MANNLDQAIAHHREGRLADAYPFYEAAIAENERPDPLILYYAGVAAAGLNRLDEAAHHLATASMLFPGRADFAFAHGDVLARLGRHAEAAAAFGESAAADPANIAAQFNMANSLRGASRPQEAASAYRKVLAADENMLPALANLATTLAEIPDFSALADLLGDMACNPAWRPHFVAAAKSAIARAAMAGKSGHIVDEALTRLAASQGDNAGMLAMSAYFALMGRDFPLAHGRYLQAYATTPGDPDIERHLAILQAALGGNATIARAADDVDGAKAAEALKLFTGLNPDYHAQSAAFEAFAACYPASEPILQNYLFCAMGAEDRATTMRLLRQLVELAGIDVPVAAGGMQSARNEESDLTIAYLGHVVSRGTTDFVPYLVLSIVLHNRGRLGDALDMNKAALERAPDNIEVNLKLASLAHKVVGLSEAEIILKHGLKYHPHAPELLSHLGSIRMFHGDIVGAGEAYDAARAHIGPGEGEKFEMQLLFSNYRPDLPPETVSMMHFAWGEGLVARQARHACAVTRPSAMKPRLKVGYVSCDYKLDASPAYFSAPLIFNHDPDRVEVFCYSTVPTNDEVTIEFRRRVKNWREIWNMSDDEAIALIMSDGIDILVDLAGHTMEPRFAVFARKPAPIQVNWLGYPNTTGLPTIDYRFTDEAADPTGVTDHLHRETLYRLPNFLCYQPPPSTPAVSPLPALGNGHVTFGCFNNTNKITEQVVDTWMEILRRMPRSRIILKARELMHERTVDSFVAKFIDRGLEAGRISCFPQFPSKFDHLQTYGDVDLALDPFPYNGTTTTLEGLWMGVPIVTLEGRVHAARVGHSLMTALGTTELVAQSLPEYIDIAVALANDTDRLKHYRDTLRPRLQASTLMDAKTFAHRVEDAYFDMWARAVARTPEVAAIP